MKSLDTKRLAQVAAWPLGRGSHEENEHGELCLMEAVAYVAGEPWSDTPACACPILGAFMRSWNDGLPSDEDRDRLLKPYVQKLIGTKSTEDVGRRRGWMAMDWLIRVHTAKWLDMVPALQQHATTLRELDEIVNEAGLIAATGKLNVAKWEAAAAWEIAGETAGETAWEAAWAAAWETAGTAAWAAAWETAGTAAWAAARTAARATLTPTTQWLQASALDLIDRMLAVQPSDAA